MTVFFKLGMSICALILGISHGAGVCMGDSWQHVMVQVCVCGGGAYLLLGCDSF